MREDDTHIVRYTIHKIKRLMPYVLVTVLASYFVVNFSLFRAGDLRGAIHQAQDLSAELLLMRVFIHTPDQMIFYCGNLWYLSALLAGLLVGVLVYHLSDYIRTRLHIDLLCIQWQSYS